MDMLLGKSLLAKDEQLYSAGNILRNKKVVVYYFSAAWVTTCENLLPTLKRVYNEGIKRNSAMEVIYVSFDNNEQDFKNEFLMKHGQWMAIPYKDVAIEELRWRYGITNLPHLIVVKVEDGTIITRFGKLELFKLGINVLVTWFD